MPVGAVLIQGLSAFFDAENTPANSASVTLNFAPTLVVATTSINTVRHTMNNLGIEFSDIALISSFQGEWRTSFTARKRGGGAVNEQRGQHYF